jgi:hypothetical protein
MSNELAKEDNLTVAYHVYIEFDNTMLYAHFRDDEKRSFDMAIPVENIFQSRFPEAVVRTNYFIVRGVWSEEKADED